MDVVRAALREIVCPVMWAELVSIAIFIGGMLVMAAILSEREPWQRQPTPEIASSSARSAKY